MAAMIAPTMPAAPTWPIRAAEVALFEVVELAAADEAAVVEALLL